MNQKGYFLIEALMALLLLSLTLVALIGSTGQALKIFKRQTETTHSLLKMEEIFFDLETGLRPDLVRYGGTEKSDKKSEFQVLNTVSDHHFAIVNVILKPEAETFRIQAFLPERQAA